MNYGDESFSLTRTAGGNTQQRYFPSRGDIRNATGMFDHGGHSRGFCSDLQLWSVAMIRSLIQLGGTLKTLPRDRFITLKLTYTADTPDNYEPKFFRPCSKEDGRRVGLFAVFVFTS